MRLGGIAQRIGLSDDRFHGAGGYGPEKCLGGRQQILALGEMMPPGRPSDKTATSSPPNRVPLMLLTTND